MDTGNKVICKDLREWKEWKEWKEWNTGFEELSLERYTMRMDFMFEDECCTEILINFQEQRIAIRNLTEELIHRAFGVTEQPTWEDFEDFLRSRCFPETRGHLRLVLSDLGLDSYDPLTIIEKTEGRMAEDLQWVRITYFDCSEAMGRERFADS